MQLDGVVLVRRVFRHHRAGDVDVRAAVVGVGEQDVDGVRPLLLLGLLIVLEHHAHVVGVADGDVALAGIDALDLEPVVAGGLARQVGLHAFEPRLGPLLAVWAIIEAISATL